MRSGLRSLVAIICIGAAPLGLAAQEEEPGKYDEEGGVRGREYRVGNLYGRWPYCLGSGWISEVHARRRL